MSTIVPTTPSNCASTLLAYRWPGYKPTRYYQTCGRWHLVLTARSCEAICPYCGTTTTTVHGRQKRSALDCPLFAHTPLVLEFASQRYRCGCGRCFTRQPAFIAPRARLTHALVLSIQQLVRLTSLTLSAVHKLIGFSCPTLKKIDCAQLQYCDDKISFHGVQNLAIDEFSRHKGHRYATVVMDNDTCRVLWVGKGKSKAAVQPFFTLRKERGVASNIRSVACDQNAAYPSLVRENLPRATLVYDLFPVMAHGRQDVLKPAKEQSLRQAIERLKTQAQEAQHSDNAVPDSAGLQAQIRAVRRQCAHCDWNLVQPLEVKDERKRKKQEQRLQDLLQDHALLAALYPVAEALRHLWREKSPLQARQHLQNLRLLLLQINRTFSFSPAKRFALMWGHRMEGIVKAGLFGFTTNRLEGANNKIKVLKRVAYGYRNHEYFFLKIKSALPGKFTLPLYEPPTRRRRHQ